jgi:hypothetical protein
MLTHSRLERLRARHAAAVARGDSKWIAIYGRAAIRAVRKGREWVRQ